MRSLVLFSLLLASLFVQASERFVVEMERPLSAAELQALNHKFDAEIFWPNDIEYFNRLYTITGNKEEISALPLVKKVEAVFPVSMSSIHPQKLNNNPLSDDQLLPYQWWLENNEQMVVVEGKSDIHMKRIRGKQEVQVGLKVIQEQLPALMKKEVVVAVIDSGVDYLHPELKDAILKNEVECDAQGKIILDSQEDKDGNGFPGDCLGWNFTKAKTSPYAKVPYDNTGHGTHVSGIISAKSNNGDGVSGVSDKIRILPLKVLGDDGDEEIALSDRIALAILYAVKRNVDVINLSLGWPKSMDTQYLQEAIKRAIQHNIVIVAAAGNNNSEVPILPCGLDEVICVGALAPDGSKASFSNFGSHVNTWAPGLEILSTYPRSLVPISFAVPNFDILSGTSQATPMVSANAALIKSVFPEIKLNEVYARLNTFSELMNISGSILLEEKSFIRPVVKAATQAVFRESNPLFQFELPIKNFWKETQNIEIELESQSPHVALERTKFSLPQLATNQGVKLLIRGKITDTTQEAELKLNIKITAEEKTETFSHKLPLVRYLDQELQTLPVTFQEKTHYLGKVQSGELIPFIETVRDRFYQGANPHYFLLEKNAEVKGKLSLYAFQAKNDRVQEASNSFQLENVKELISADLIDMNGDQNPEYLLYYLVEENDEQFLRFDILGQDLQLQQRWNFSPEGVIPEQTFFVQQEQKDGSNLALPVFFAKGNLPNREQEKGFFKRPDTTVKNRLYYLEPSLNDGKISLITRSLSGKQFETELKKRLGIKKNTRLDFLGLLPQSSEDFERSELKMTIKYGKGPLYNYKVLIIQKNFEYQITELDSKQMIYLMDQSGQKLKEDALFINQIAINDKGEIKKAGPYAWGQVNNEKGKILDIENNSNALIASNAPVEQLLASFDSASFLKNNDTLFLWQDGKLHTRNIERFSFLPGTLFSEMFAPVMVNNKGKMTPALYIDSTQMSMNRLQVITAEDGIKNAAKWSLMTPSRCRPLNPVRQNGTNYALAFLCLDQNYQWQFKFLPLSE